MIRKETFHSRKFIVAISMAITLITIIAEYAIFHGDIIFYEYGILPVLTLVLGPYGAIGFVLIEIPYWIVSLGATNIVGMALNAVVIIILGTIPWKIWYAISTKRNIKVLNINTLISFVKLAVIISVFMLQHTFFFTASVKWIVSNTVSLQYATIAIGVIVLFISLGIWGKYEIPFYTPRVQFKRVMPNYIYDIILLIAVIIEFVTAVLLHYPNSAYLNLAVLLMLIVFLMKPFDEEVFRLDNTMKLNIFSKITLSIFAVMLIISATLSVIYIRTLMYDMTTDFFIMTFLDMFLDLLWIFIIPLVIYMLFMEERVIKPIQQLSRYLSQDIDDYKDLDELKENLKSIKVNNELKSLSESLLNMEEELMDYSQNLITLTKETERFETELKLAKDIQYSMVPTDFEEFCENWNLSLWGSMKAAREVGGDFYDYFTIDDENIGFAIGDVSGKGVTAALIMVKAMTSIQDFAIEFDDLSEVFYKLNNELCKGNVEELFVTCWLGKLNIKTGELSYVNAGHNPPLIRQDNGDFKYLDTEHGLVLAIMEDMPYEKHTLQLNHGDSLFLYTDGVTEANMDYNGFYGEKRLEDILNVHKDDDLDVVIKSIDEDISDFYNGGELFDDTTMFIIRFEK